MSTVSDQVALQQDARRTTKKETSSDLMRTQRIWGWIFLSPWIIGILAFTVIPIVASLGFSFTNFELNKPDQVEFVGLANYVKLFNDPLVGVAIKVTLRFAALALPLAIILPIALAALLNNKNLKAKRIFRTLFYMPFIVPVVSAVYIWGGMLNSQTGWFNRALAIIGVNGPNWLDSQVWIYPALVIIGLWGLGNSYLITLAAMQAVPTELYEAATVDGAGAFGRFRHVTFPMISPVVFYNLVLAVIGLFRYFEIPFVLKGSEGFPGQSTWFFNIHFFRTTFGFLDMGYGSTLAWLLFAMTMAATLILFRTARYWVFYSSGEMF
ncbi:MAG: sugar ABC transporter permease [Chloroflexi bacterium]|nr:MAG: sugar ABC transporter permease [Phototrophicales bacterium]RMF79223.1 MAG: sugar ABC transporter permease [Chloroflexota bacterium]